VRLDHLLSKEHWPAARSWFRARSWTIAPRRVLTGGTSISWRWHVPACKYNPVLHWTRGEWNAAGGWQRLARCWVLKARARAHLRGPVRRPGPFLVDEPRRIPRWNTSRVCGVGATAGKGAARFLRTAQWTRASLWLKFLRAHGGCLGTRNRRRT
jgi:hypothetical protein